MSCIQNAGMHACAGTQSRSTLCDPMDWEPPVSSVHGISKAKILEWVAISFSRGSFQPRIEPESLASPAWAAGFFTTRATACMHAKSQQVLAQYWLLNTRENPWPISFPSLTNVTDIHHPWWEAAAGIPRS